MDSYVRTPREAIADPVTTDAPQRRWLTLLTLCTAVLIAQLDTSIVNLAVRPIGQDLHASVEELQWVVDSYNLMYAVLLLTGGLLADLYGRRLVFMTGAAVVMVASVVCAFAPTVLVLITGRAAAGVGAALLMPASLAIIRVVWHDAKERGQALGIWTGCNGLGLAIGPTTGGLLIDGWGWRSIFWIVVPAALAALALAIPSIPESSDPHDRHFDMPAQVLGALTLGGLSLAAIESHGAIAISSVALATAITALILFLRIESRMGMGALVPLDLFSIREFQGAAAATAGMTFAMYGAMFLIPMTWLATARFDAVGSGLALLPTALVYIAVSPFSGALSTRFGARAVSVGGVATIACGLALIGSTSDAASIVPGEIGLALTGLGMGTASGPLLGAAVASVTAARAGTAASLVNVARIAGATLGVAVMGAAYALADGGTRGLCVALLLGAAVQLTAAAVALTKLRTISALA